MRERYKLKLYRNVWCITWATPTGTKRISTGEKDAEAAKRFLEDWLAEHDKQERLTVSDIWGRYCIEKAGIPAVARMGHEWKSISLHFGHLHPDQITDSHCKNYIAHRREQGRKDGTILTELNDLSTALKWAVKRKLISSAPHIDKPPKPDPKTRWLTETEISALLRAAHMPHIRLAIELMLSTAGRIGAILELTWDRVDLESGSIDLAKTGTGRRKGRAHVAMTRSIRATLQTAQRAALTDHVVEWAGRPVKSIKRGFAKAVADAGLEDVTPHVLRHTAAVHMAKRGVSMAMIAQYLGHSDDRITQRVYARFAPEHMRSAASALDAMLNEEFSLVQSNQKTGTCREQ